MHQQANKLPSAPVGGERDDRGRPAKICVGAIASSDKYRHCHNVFSAGETNGKPS
jgi:hypothetical protein